MAKAELHNRVLRAAEKRAEKLEEKLADVLRPLIYRAGKEAATAFSAMATEHLTAAASDLWLRDSWVLAGMTPSDAKALVASLAIRADAAPVAENQTMVAVRPRVAEAAALADGGGIEAGVVHVTLAALGEYDGDLTDVATALAPVVGTHAPLSGQVGGVGHFADNGKGHPSIVLPSVPGLVELRVAVTEALADAGIGYGRGFGYLPHATTDYSADPVAPDAGKIGTPLHFDSVWVVRGDREYVELPLTGVAPITAAAPGDPGAPPGWTAPAVDEIFDMDAFVAAIKAKTDPVRNAVIATVMGTTLEKVGLAFDVTNPFTAKVLSTAGQHVTSIAETTREDIRKIIDRSYQEGLSIPHTAEAIRAGMKESSLVRARMIARTELVGAVNGGSLAAAQIVGDATDTEYAKVWMTAAGAQYPRHYDYDDLDGQTVEIGGYFEVGESQLEFPGDPNGDPGEVINCRCTMSYEDAAGNEVGDVVDSVEE